MDIQDNKTQKKQKAKKIKFEKLEKRSSQKGTGLKPLSKEEMEKLKTFDKMKQ